MTRNVLNQPVLIVPCNALPVQTRRKNVLDVPETEKMLQLVNAHLEPTTPKRKIVQNVTKNVLPVKTRPHIVSPVPKEESNLLLVLALMDISIMVKNVSNADINVIPAHLRILVLLAQPTELDLQFVIAH